MDRLIILGCGAALPASKRNPTAQILENSGRFFLIDCGEGTQSRLRENKLSFEKITHIFISHMHGDQTHGINDLRSFYINSRKQLNVYADKYTSKYLNSTFSYIFKSYSKEYPATLKLNKLPKKIFTKNNNKKIGIQSIMVEHGKVKSNCFIINKKLAYISDVSKIYNKDHKYFKNLQYLIIDCLWYNFHPSHFNLESSLAVIKKFKPKKAILTNLSPVLDYKVLKKKMPKNVIPAHDGLTINL